MEGEAELSVMLGGSFLIFFGLIAYYAYTGASFFIYFLQTKGVVGVAWGTLYICLLGASFLFMGIQIAFIHLWERLYKFSERIERLEYILISLLGFAVGFTLSAFAFAIPWNWLVLKIYLGAFSLAIALSSILALFSLLGKKISKKKLYCSVILGGVLSFLGVYILIIASIIEFMLSLLGMYTPWHITVDQTTGKFIILTSYGYLLYGLMCFGIALSIRTSNVYDRALRVIYIQNIFASIAIDAFVAFAVPDLKNFSFGNILAMIALVIAVGSAMAREILSGEEESS